MSKNNLECNASHIKIYNHFFKVPEFLEFMDRKKSLVYYFLFSAIIRESPEVKSPLHGANYIYKSHFLKKQLVSRYSQEKIADYLNTSASRVSVYIKQLEEDGFIKKIYRKTTIGVINYYQFGTFEGTFGKKDYKEHIWLNDHFSDLYKKRKKSESENRKESADDYLLNYICGGDEEKYNNLINEFEIS